MLGQRIWLADKDMRSSFKETSIGKSVIVKHFSQDISVIAIKEVLFMPIRIAVSGEMHGPELPETIFLLGREKSIKHIDQVLATL